MNGKLIVNVFPAENTADKLAALGYTVLAVVSGNLIATRGVASERDWRSCVDELAAKSFALQFCSFVADGQPLDWRDHLRKELEPVDSFPKRAVIRFQ